MPKKPETFWNKIESEKECDFKDITSSELIAQKFIASTIYIRSNGKILNEKSNYGEDSQDSNTFEYFIPENGDRKRSHTTNNFEKQY